MRTTAGVILAGGRSSRMGAGHKALLKLGGRPLLSHVIGRLQPRLNRLLLSCECEAPEFDEFGLPVVVDLLPRYRGPLIGLYSALKFLEGKGLDERLVLCPCDAPFIPDDLVQALLDGDQDQAKPVVISYLGVMQPTFSMWRTHHLPVIQEAVVNRGMGGLKHVLNGLPHTVVEWPATEPSPFFNVNTPEDLKTAERWLDRTRK